MHCGRHFVREYIPASTEATMGFQHCSEVHEVGSEEDWLLHDAVDGGIRFRYVDPTLEHDLSSRTRPWALSPLVATMPHLAVSSIDDPRSIPVFPPAKPLEDSTPFLPISQHHSVLGKFGKGKDKQAGKRKTYFHSAAKRKEFMFSPRVSTSYAITAANGW